MTNEPLVTVASLTAIATALIAALIAFGLNLTEAQTAGLMGLVAVAAPFVVAAVSRGKVTPNAKVTTPTQE